MMFLEQAQTVAELQDHYRKVRQRLNPAPPLLKSGPVPLPRILSIAPPQEAPAPRQFIIGPHQDHHLTAWKYEKLQRQVDKWRSENLIIDPSEKPSTENIWPKIDLDLQASLIVAEVGRVHGFEYDKMLSKRGERKLALARLEAMWRVYCATDWSFARMGRFFGGRDHTTMIYAVRSYNRIAFGVAYNKPRIRIINPNGGAA